MFKRPNLLITPGCVSQSPVDDKLLPVCLDSVGDAEVVEVDASSLPGATQWSRLKLSKWSPLESVNAFRKKFIMP